MADNLPRSEGSLRQRTEGVGFLSVELELKGVEFGDPRCVVQGRGVSVSYAVRVQLRSPKP